QPVEIQIDLGGVERSSSAAIALLLDWVAQAGRAGIELRFAHWPEALRRIAIFSNVDGLLGLETDRHG
ncbi:MAG: lipid asymmetry maintenance protein MlaB, partial [Halochromatium sp.]